MKEVKIIVRSVNEPSENTIKETAKILLQIHKEHIKEKGQGN